jgi:hypothetical protein
MFIGLPQNTMKSMIQTLHQDKLNHERKNVCSVAVQIYWNNKRAAAYELLERKSARRLH